MSKKNKLLILSDWYLPAINAGGPVRSVSAIVSALKNDFDISLLTSDRDFGSSQSYPLINVNSWINNDGFRMKYISPENLNMEIRKEVLSDYDKIYMNSLFSIPFTITPLRLLSGQSKNDKVILATRGMLGQGALQLKSFKKKSFLFVAKLFGLYKGITWHASTSIEQEEIENIFGKSIRVKSIENLPACKIEKFIPIAKNKKQLKLVFVSRISPKKNLLYLIKLLKKFEKRVELDIYGPIEDENYWAECEGLIKNQNHLICYKGVLEPDKLSSVISNYHLFVLPTLNENFGHIFIETLNSSVPLLISDQSPWVNLAAKKAGIEIPLTNSDLWLQWLSKFYEMSGEDYLEWRKGAWNLAQVKLNQKELKKQYIKMFSE